MGFLDQVKSWFSKDKSGSGGLLGEPGDTQRSGPSSGGPSGGPETGGSAGPAGAEQKPE
jgi:hypothetical protein